MSKKLSETNPLPSDHVTEVKWICCTRQNVQVPTFEVVTLKSLVWRSRLCWNSEYVIKYDVTLGALLTFIYLDKRNPENPKIDTKITDLWWVAPTIDLISVWRQAWRHDVTYDVMHRFDIFALHFVGLSDFENPEIATKPSILGRVVPEIDVLQVWRLPWRHDMTS